MRTDLKTKNLISNDNPFDSIVATNPLPIDVPNAVDWVELTIQDTLNPNFQSSGWGYLLLSDGRLVDYTPSSGVGVNTTSLRGGKYKITIRHRNHLAISTDIDIDISAGYTTTLDFTTNQNVKGDNQTMIQPGIYGLKMGNTNGNDRINSQDRIALRLSPDRTNVYSPLDINMDGNISSLDRVLNRSVSDSIEKI